MRTNLYLRFRFTFYVLLLTLSPGLGLFGQTPDSTLFRDDFNRVILGSSWQGELWSIVNGAAYNFTSEGGGTLKTTKGYSQDSYIIETTAKGFTTNYYREFRITFGQADLSNHHKLYQLRYTGWLGGRLTLSRSFDNIYSPLVLDEVPVFPDFNSTDWYKFKIARYKSGLIQVYVNKGSGYGTTPVLEAIDLTYTELGHTGWHVGTEAFHEDFYVDRISARKPGIEKPAIKEKPVEDDFITQVSAKSGRTYKVAKLIPGVKQLIDREYTITSVPEYLKGASFIQAANNDKFNTVDSFLTFFVKTSAIVYIGYDPRSTAIPGWLKSWYKTGDRIGTSDPDVNYLDVYSKLVVERGGQIYPYPSVLGGNLASPALGAKTNYLVAAIKRPGAITLQAEDALLSGAVVANNHKNYKGTGFADYKNLTQDYIEWTVQIDVPGTYHLNFTFANASSADRSLEITANGIFSGTVTFIPVSSSWDAWANFIGLDIFFSSGVHKIRLTATGTSGPNIDQLVLSLVSASPPVVSTSTPMAFPESYVPNNKASGKLPDQYYKAYPNPFLQSTNIYYKLKEKAKVILAIYNLQGQQIQLLENGTREAGNYHAIFNAGRFAKGIYFYRLQIGNDVRIGKLIKE